ncbi:MAG: zf-HC2 domain-containing protein [Desulfurivibrionaceae bacterium]|nr:zf-HC2 domain-containing protein [Desulfurivibrionaceae bacterium]
MNCQEARPKIHGLADNTLNRRETRELQAHLDGCGRCGQEYAQEKRMLAALRNLPVPPPSKDFVRRSFARARARHEEKKRRRSTISLWGGAVAAGVALWLMVAGAPGPITPEHEQPGLQAISLKINEQRLVQVVVDAPRDMLQADLLIELPSQLEVAGFPGRREIEWTADLRKGRNLLNLPLIAKSGGMAELITHIHHENKSKMLSLVMHVFHDELTKRGQGSPDMA